MIDIKKLEEIADSISGTMQLGGITSICESILERGITQKEEEYIGQYLEATGIIECESCGWFTYPDEATDGLCMDCVEDN